MPLNLGESLLGNILDRFGLQNPAAYFLCYPVIEEINSFFRSTTSATVRPDNPRVV